MTVKLPPGHDALRDCVKQLAPSLADKDFLTTGAPLPAMWAPPPPDPDADPDDEPPPFSLGPAFNEIVNYIPAMSPVYRPTSRTLTQAYALILANLRLTSSGNLPDLSAQIALQQKFAQQIDDLRAKLFDQYTSSASYPRLPFQEYLISSPDSYSLSALQGQLNAATMDVEAKLGNSGPIVASLQAYRQLIDPQYTAQPILPWKPAMPIDHQIKDWRASRNLIPTAVHGKSSDGSYSFSEVIDKSGGGHGLFGSFFWGKDSSSSSDEINLDRADESIEMTMTVKAWAEVPVVINTLRAGGSLWWNDALLTEYQQFTAPFTGARVGTNPAYGPTGLLPWRIASVIIAYQPTITIAMSADAYAEWDKVTHTQSSWGAGPFGIFGGGGSSHDTTDKKVTQSATDHTITIADNGNYPLILGMTMEYVP